MATGPDHYREAERLLRKAHGEELELAKYTIAAAQTHATLALAAATALAPHHKTGGNLDAQAWDTVANTQAARS